MFVYGASFMDVEGIVSSVSQSSYDGNIDIRTGEDRSNGRGPRCTFTLRTIFTDGCGARASASAFGSGTGPHGRRRTVAACWHVHYEVLQELFETFPDARVVTQLATYTAATFVERAWATADQNAGSQLYPLTAPELCECDHANFRERHGPEGSEAEDLGITVSPVPLDYGPGYSTRDPGARGDESRPNTSLDYFLDQLDAVLAES